MSTEPPPLPSPPRRRRERLGIFYLAILGCVLGIGALVWPELQGARRIVVREDGARAALLEIQAAEAGYLASAGRYGFVGDLAAAGMLPGLTVTRTDDVAWVESDGYRVEVLLPHARLGPGVVGIAPDGSGKPVDPDLAKRHFSVVARPLEPAVTGFRMWYVDEQGELYLNEGVIDDASALRNELPTQQVVRNSSLDTASYLLWQKASQVPPTQD